MACSAVHSGRFFSSSSSHRKVRPEGVCGMGALWQGGDTMRKPWQCGSVSPITQQVVSLKLSDFSPSSSCLFLTPVKLLLRFLNLCIITCSPHHTINVTHHVFFTRCVRLRRPSHYIIICFIVSKRYLIQTRRRGLFVKQTDWSEFS